VIGLARRVPSNSLLWRGVTLFLSNGIGQALAFLGSVAVARLLGVESFGHYAGIMALVFVLGLLVEAGLEATLTREAAGEPHRTRQLLYSSLIIKLWLGGAVTFLLFLPPVASMLAPDPSVQIAVQLAGPLIILTSFNASFGAVFRAWGRMNYVLMINVLGLGLQLAGTIVILLVLPDLTALFAWLIAIQVVELIMGIAFFQRGNHAEGEAEPLWDKSPVRADRRKDLASTDLSNSYAPLLKRSWPFALAGVLSALTLRIDLFLIEALRGSAQVGIFSAGTRLSELLALAPNSFFGALFPEMSALHKASSSEEVTRIYGLTLRRMALTGILLALLGLLLADLLVWICFGPAYAAAATPLRVLALRLVPLLANRTTTVRLYSSHQEHKANLAVALSLTMRLMGGMLLIPQLGATGAALAGLVAECAVTTTYWLTGAMEGGGLRRSVRGPLRLLLGLRYRGFKPGEQPDHTVTVAGLHLNVYATVFDPSLHFTSAYLAEYLREIGVVPPGATVLDLGTGSGIAAIAAARAGAGRVVATDLNPAAIRCVTDNASHYGLSSIILARQGDMFDPVRGERFDLIISNPPYLRGVPANIAEQAYKGGEHLEWFDRFASEAAQHLQPGGRVLMVLGDVADLGAIRERFTNPGWQVRLAARRDLLVESLLIYELRPKG
jgi:release factor glutamine methyltransferase